MRSMKKFKFGVCAMTWPPGFSARLNAATIHNPFRIRYMLRNIQREYCIELPGSAIDETDNVSNLEMTVRKAFCCCNRLGLLHERLRKIDTVILADVLRNIACQGSITAPNVQYPCISLESYASENCWNAARFFACQQFFCVGLVVELFEFRWIGGLVHSTWLFAYRKGL